MLGRIALVFVAALATGSFALPCPAVACSCFPTSPAEDYARADAVFRGRVVRTAWVGPAGEVNRTGKTTFEVSETLKGRPAQRVTVQHGTMGSACGVTFRAGDTVVVLAERDRAGTLRTEACLIHPRKDWEALRRAAAARGSPR